MKPYEVKLAILTAQADGAECLKTFIRLEREQGMTGVSRSNFEEAWNTAQKYPAQFKLQIVVERENELINDLCDALLRVDPAWEDVKSHATMVADVKRSQAGLKPALELLSKHNPALADELTQRAKEILPGEFSE